MSWESDDCDCAEDWTCMRHRGELLTMSKQGGTMTDEALKPWTQRGEKLMTENERLRTENAALLDQIRSVVGIHDEVDRLRAEIQTAYDSRNNVARMLNDSERREADLRAENQRLVEAIRESVEDCDCYPCSKLRAAIEGK